MHHPPTPPLESSDGAHPVESGERLVLLDALRGFALCGVFVSNVSMWFSGRAFLPRAKLDALLSSASALDMVAIDVCEFFVNGKCITLLSFLFGLGFALQLGRAEERGASIVPLYARRQVTLLGIGLAHLLLLWYGDVLSTYALLGLGLLLLRKRSDRTLLLGAAVLILVMPVVGVLFLLWPRLIRSPEAAAALTREVSARFAALNAATLGAFTSGGYLDVVRAGSRYYAGYLLKPMLALFPPLLGRFLLGLVAGRRRLFEAAQHLPLLRRLLAWGLVFGVLGNGAGVAIQQLMARRLLDPQRLWTYFALAPAQQLGELGLAGVYVAGFALAAQRPGARRLLSVLAPVGRMALSNYLSQTVISLLLFDGLGLGLIGALGPARCMALTLGIFSVQVAWSHLWLARFRFGPAEWVWRSLTYGKAQPMRV